MKFKERTVKEPVRKRRKTIVIDSPETNAANSLSLMSDEELVSELSSRGYSVTKGVEGDSVFGLRVSPVEGKSFQERYSSELLALRAFLEYQRKVPETIKNVSLTYSSGSSERELWGWPVKEPVRTPVRLKRKKEAE